LPIYLTRVKEVLGVRRDLNYIKSICSMQCAYHRKGRIVYKKPRFKICSGPQNIVENMDFSGIYFCNDF